MGGGSHRQHPKNHVSNSSKKGRTLETFFCPFCGSRYRAYSRRCPALKCEKVLFVNRKCANCHLPRSRDKYLFCRLCGLLYDDAGLVETVKEREPIVASVRPPVTTVAPME